MAVFCKEHGLLMEINDKRDDFIFNCSYGCEEEGDPADSLVSEVHRKITLEDNHEFWKNIAFDITNEKVNKKCVDKKCQKNIMAKVRLESGVPAFVCQCGAKWKKSWSK